MVNNNDYDQCIRIEEKARRKEYVINDDTGPGCITRWWIPLFMERSALISQMVRIYLDGNDKPTIEVNYCQLISGRAFVKPLSWQDGKATLTLSDEVILTAGQSLEISLTK